jgi:uncharacterized protein (TIGR02145 family)
MRTSVFSLSIVFILLCTSVSAQKGDITLNFYGHDAASLNSVNLEQVVVKNLTQDCDTLIYGPNPQLILEFPDGINELNSEGFAIGNNYPNPFSGTTAFDLQVNEPDQIHIRLINTQGAIVAEDKGSFQKGTHSISVTIAKAGIYYAEVSNSKTIRSLKLVNKTSSSFGSFEISSAKTSHNSSLMKQSSQIMDFVFQPGDELQIIASAETYPDEALTVSPITDMNYIFDMRPVPIAGFVVENESGAFPFTTAFTDMSERNPTTWQWDFGDGETSSEQNPIHNFELVGLYSVTLIAGNEYGNDTIEMENYIDVKDVAIVCDTTSGYAPLLVNFHGICNHPAISAWTWYFGDGETSNEQNPSHIYMEEGTYNYVTLTVLSQGNIYTDDIIIHVQNDLAEVNFVADTTDGWVPQTIHFTSYTNINNPTGYQWNFGDGYTSNDVNPSHTYDNIGTYTVMLQVFNNNGVKTATKEDYITIRYCPGAVQDLEGNIYETVAIGTNCWMRENLNMGTRINGDLGGQTDNGIIEKFCYDNQEANCDEYGGLYQWDELMQYETAVGAQGLCPDDWHVAISYEWANMIQYLGGGQMAGEALQSTTGWDLYGNGNNNSGFTALPGGKFWGDEEYHDRAEFAYFWSTDGAFGEYGWGLSYAHFITPVQAGEIIGFSARCVKDNTMKE